MRATVASRQMWRCNTCGVLFKALWHVDHVVRFSDGGGDTLDNMQALCADCHADKTAVENRGERSGDATIPGVVM